MAVQRKRFVLGQDVDVAKIGVNAVRKSDIDDAVLTRKRHGRLGAIAGEGEESFAGTTGK